MNKLLIIGAGGFGREIAWLVRDVHGDAVSPIFAVERAYLDAPYADGIPIIAMDEVPADVHHYVVAVGEPALRRRLSAECDARGMLPATLVHPGVLRSSRIDIGPGSVICAGTILTTGIRIGRHVQINLACTVGHDVDIGDFTTISPGVHISGNVCIKHDAFLGTGANLINGTAGNPLTIGAGAVVAAGACVTRDVPDGSMVAGVPAMRKR